MIMVINRSQEEARNKVGFQALSHSAQSYFASPIYTVERKRKFLTFFNSSLKSPGSGSAQDWVGERGSNPALL